MIEPCESNAGDDLEAIFSDGIPDRYPEREAKMIPEDQQRVPEGPGDA
jgi:hypothetical protein